MRGNDELRIAILNEVVNQHKQSKLSLRGKGRLRFVEQKDAFADSILENGQECLAVRLHVQRSSAIPRVRIALEIWISSSVIQ